MHGRCIFYQITMLEVLSELVPLLGANLIQHVAVVIAMAAVGVPVFALADRVLSSGVDASSVHRRRMRGALYFAVIVFVLLILVVMGYLLFNLLTGRYSSDEDGPNSAFRSTTEYKLFRQPTGQPLLRKPTMQSLPRSAGRTKL
jgi:NADH:ubiquinone oxidoreductase subunit 6 (subunit J)